MIFPLQPPFVADFPAVPGLPRISQVQQVKEIAVFQIPQRCIKVVKDKIHGDLTMKNGDWSNNHGDILGYKGGYTDISWRYYGSLSLGTCEKNRFPNHPKPQFWSSLFSGFLGSLMELLLVLSYLSWCFGLHHVMKNIMHKHELIDIPGCCMNTI